MSKRIPIGQQADAINRNSPFVQVSFDLARQDVFATSFAVDFLHYKAMPSPIGQNDKGAYRRSDGVDTITSNGMIYTIAGIFSATMTDDKRDQKRSDGGLLDTAEGRLVMPRFYNKLAVADGDRIYLAPGDRLYIKDPNADVNVSTYHKMDYEPDKENVPVYPINKMEIPIVDSLGIEYKEGVDYQITQSGNIKWLSGGKNPGIDPETGKGRIYSVRYLYKAYWYVVSLPKEIRVTNVTEGGVRTPERMAYHAVIVREFVFHNQNKGDEANQNKSKTPNRVQDAPKTSIDPSSPVIPVDMSTVLDGDEE